MIETGCSQWAGELPLKCAVAEGGGVQIVEVVSKPQLF